MEVTDFENTKPQPTSDNNNKIKILNSYMDSGSTKYDRDTPENHVCNKKPKIYKWVNKRFASIFNKFDPSVSMPPKRIHNTVLVLS